VSPYVRLILSSEISFLRIFQKVEHQEIPLSFRRLILTSNFMSYVSQFPHLPIYNSIILQVSNHLSTPSNKHIRLQFEHSLNTFETAPLRPIHRSSPPWTLKQPFIWIDLTEIPPSSNTSYIWHIRCILDGYRMSPRRLKIETQIGSCLFNSLHLSARNKKAHTRRK